VHAGSAVQKKEKGSGWVVMWVGGSPDLPKTGGGGSVDFFSAAPRVKRALALALGIIYMRAKWRPAGAPRSAHHRNSNSPSGHRPSQSRSNHQGYEREALAYGAASGRMGHGAAWGAWGRARRTGIGSGWMDGPLIPNNATSLWPLKDCVRAKKVTQLPARGLLPLEFC
jgi:hypothetical protein